jgi:hypothetical protein
MMYGSLSREFLAAKSLHELQLAHRFEDGVFLPILTPGSLSDENMSGLAQRFSQLVRPEDLAHINFEIFSFWNNFSELVKAMGHELAHGFESLLRAKYWKVVAKVVQARIASETGSLSTSSVAASRGQG